MTDKDGTQEVVAVTSSPLVARSTVPPNLPYAEYRQTLRRDFLFCCAYCTTSEAEASGLRFTIDHYEPRTARPDLEREYGNLMYCCDGCNLRKGDRTPPQTARDAGYRFYRPDEDTFVEHFRPSGQRVESESKAGEYTIEALDLNRQSLRRVRELRMRLGLLGNQVAEGLRGLKGLKLDRLPLSLRGRALAAINNAEDVEDRLASAIDGVLESLLRSPLLDEDAEAGERAIDRAKILQQLEVMFPGAWRGREIAKNAG
ncbi:HNH endonuclease [Terricaulis sp.]|uniref:HNH endonuclease n=1 Tax=Terricaulis sp. TaxID=2768686 RepID=UPI002AC74F0A|nr:HNH endonuclease [Terricaulis sp.]MDZ4690533.1 hypothetical protein [Terricaulis sp.]